MVDILDIPKARLTRDMRKAAETLGRDEARFLVDAYYQLQRDRIRAGHRIGWIERDAEATGNPIEPHAVISWLGDQSAGLERQIQGALDRYSAAHPVGRWMRAQKGIGPVIAAGFLSGADMTRPHMRTVGGLWAHCGVVPGKDRRVKGRSYADPETGYNPRMKRLTWIAGECFKRLSSDDPDAYYRHVYDKRKAYEQAKNEAGDYAEQAAKALTEKRYGDDTKARKFYEAGKLPPGHIDKRCVRYAAKLFLSHLHEVWFKFEFPGEDYPKPYPIAHLGHAHYLPPPPGP